MSTGTSDMYDGELRRFAADGAEHAPAAAVGKQQPAIILRFQRLGNEGLRQLHTKRANDALNLVARTCGCFVELGSDSHGGTADWVGIGQRSHRCVGSCS